ncbi:MAG: glycosyltransferase [Chlorobi bacterium]|nr:glycosyltransferase [Chlorobiota bacterium]
MDIVIFTILGLYVLIHLALLAGLLKNTKKTVKSNYEPKVSIVICAKDEEDNIGDCIKSLLELDYQKEKLEIILVNDRSVDKTKDIMTSYASRNPVLKYVEITESVGKLKGKANALAQALKTATGEIIFTTDADIKVNKKWVREILSYYDEDTGVVSGYSVIEPKNLVWGVQSVDWLYLLSVASGGDGIGIPISCVGNNMSYRRKAYDEVGGYEDIKFSITEDFMLLQNISKKTSYKTKFPIDNDTINLTLPCITLSQLFRQKKRWAAGGLGEPNLGVLVGVFSWIMGAVLLSGGAYLSLQTYLIFIIVKLVSDSFFLFPAVKEFKMFKTYLYIIAFEVYFAIYVIVTSILLATGRGVVWKDQKI